MEKNIIFVQSRVKKISGNVSEKVGILAQLARFVKKDLKFSYPDSVSAIFKYKLGKSNFL